MDASVALRVMTYNILGGRNTDGRRDVGKVAAVINAAAPDVVALQEMDRGTDRARGVDIPGELARLTGMEVRFAAAMPYDGGEYGEAVLSRHPIVDSHAYPLPHRSSSEPGSL